MALRPRLPSLAMHDLLLLLALVLLAVALLPLAASPDARGISLWLGVATLGLWEALRLIAFRAE